VFELLWWSMRGWLGAAFVSAMVLSSLRADACEVAGSREFTLDPADTAAAPGAVGDVTYTIERGKGPRSEGCGKSSVSSCDDLGFVTLHFGSSPDAATDPTAVGYRVRFVGGALPDDLSVSDAPLLAPTGMIHLVWIDGASDDQEPIDFSLAITPVAKNGSEGPTSPPVHIRDDGRIAGGCSLRGKSAQGAVLPLALLALALVLRRYR
jgi:hypothetical protein